MPPAVRPLTPLEKIALDRVNSDAECKIASDALAPGRYSIDGTFRIWGTIKKGEPFEKAVPQVIPWQMMAMVALSKLNKVSGKNIQELITEVMEETEDGLKRNPEKLEALEDEIKPHVERACKKLVDKTRRTVSGPVTAHLAAAILLPIEEVVQAPGVMPQQSDIPAELTP